MGFMALGIKSFI